MFHHDAVFRPGTGHAPGMPEHAPPSAPPASAPAPAPAPPAPPASEGPAYEEEEEKEEDTLFNLEDSREPAKEGSITDGPTGNEHLDSFAGAVAEKPYETIVPENERMIWGSTPRTANQGIIALNKDADKNNLNVDDIHIFTVQGHPEMTSGMIALLVDIFETDIGENACKEGRARIANFKGSLDWFPVCLLMWALSTKHSLNLPTIYKTALGLTNMVEVMKAAGADGAALTSEQSVFVYVA